MLNCVLTPHSFSAVERITAHAEAWEPLSAHGSVGPMAAPHGRAPAYCFLRLAWRHCLALGDLSQLTGCWQGSVSCSFRTYKVLPFSCWRSARGCSELPEAAPCHRQFTEWVFFFLQVSGIVCPRLTALLLPDRGHNSASGGRVRRGQAHLGNLPFFKSTVSHDMT